jgi:hypothetical protein
MMTVTVAAGPDRIGKFRLVQNAFNSQPRASCVVVPLIIPSLTLTGVLHVADLTDDDVPLAPTARTRSPIAPAPGQYRSSRPAWR